MGTFHDISDNFAIEPLKLDLRQSPYFDLKVFYMKLTNFKSTPNHLKVNHIPLNPRTVPKANSNCVSISLRRDRVDRSSEESTYISTDMVKITNEGVHFEVLNGDELFLFGVLEPSDDKWVMSCQLSKAGYGVCKNGSKTDMEDLDLSLPKVEIYIAGCYEGVPVVLTKSLDLGLVNDASCYEDSQLSTYRCYKPETEVEFDYKNLPSPGCTDFEEDGTLSWFNAGVRVGVGIGLGVFVGLGIGVGVLVNSYQSTARTFKRRLF